MRARAIAAAVLLAPLVHSAHSAGDAAENLKPPSTLAEAIDRAGQLVGQAYTSRAPGPLLAACAETLEPWYDAAWNSAESTLSYPWLLLRCRYGARMATAQPFDEQDIRKAAEPWLARQREVLSITPTMAASIAFEYARALHSVGLGPSGTAYLVAEATRHIEAVDHPTLGSFHRAVLTAMARGTYGGWQFQEEVRSLQALFEQRLGADHITSLLTLRALAYHERFMGRPQPALAFIERAVALAHQRTPTDSVLAAHMAAEYAACLASAGRPADARTQMLLVRDVLAAQQPVSHVNLTRIHYNLAAFALDMGDYPAAIEYATQSVDHAQRSGHREMLVEARVPRATRELARLLMGQPEAASRLRDVLAETNHYEMHVGEHAVALVHHAVQTGNAELLRWAGTFADAQIARFSGPLQSDSALRPLMAAWMRAGQALNDAEVRGLLNRAMAISLTGRKQGTLALTQFNLARHLMQADPDSAAWLYKRGANALQRLRAGLPEEAAELHRAWLGMHEVDLRAYVALLIDQGRLVEAEQALQFLRDEESFEYTRRSPNLAATSKDLSYTPAEDERNRAMTELERAAEVVARTADSRLDKSNAGRLRDFYVDAEAAAHIDQLAQAVHQVIDAPAAQLRGGTAPPLRPTPTPPGTARLTYLVREAALDIVVQVGTRHQQRTIPVARADLNRAVQEARAALSSPQFDAQPALRRLWRWLIEPVHPLIAGSSVRELQVVPDGALRYVPFAALHDGRRYLAERFAIDSRWAGSARSVIETRTATSRNRPALLALGRTAGNDAHGPLPAVAQELAMLERHGATVLGDEHFTEPRLRAALASRPAIVHIASHFVLDPAGEDRSYLLLGDGTHLSLGELGRLPWQGVRLAMLSACDSGLALDAGPGRELVGFASALRRAGVRHLVATLWRVADGATAQWATAFYEPLARDPAAVFKPQGVAHAQRHWLRRHGGTSLAHPHYWAGFTWLGAD